MLLGTKNCIDLSFNIPLKKDRNKIRTVYGIKKDSAGMFIKFDCIFVLTKMQKCFLPALEVYQSTLKYQPLPI